MKISCKFGQLNPKLIKWTLHLHYWFKHTLSYCTASWSFAHMDKEKIRSFGSEVKPKIFIWLLEFSDYRSGWKRQHLTYIIWYKCNLISLQSIKLVYMLTRKMQQKSKSMWQRQRIKDMKTLKAFLTNKKSAFTVVGISFSEFLSVFFTIT